MTDSTHPTGTPSGLAPGIYITGPGDPPPPQYMGTAAERAADFVQVLHRITTRLKEEDSPRRRTALLAKKAELEGLLNAVLADAEQTLKNVLAAHKSLTAETEKETITPADVGKLPPETP